MGDLMVDRANSYATLDADGQVPLDQLDNAAGGGPHNHAGEDITSGTVADARIAAALARDSEVTTAVSDHAAAANPHPTYLTQAEGDAAYEALGAIATHSADTTAVHGIVDTSALSLTSHDHDSDYEAAGGIATHSADSTAVHGITDTAALVVDGDAAGGELAGTYPNPTVASSHAGGTHAATQAAAEATAAGALSGHAADSTAIHGITDTSVLATATDVSGAVSTHAGLADPHTGYRLESADHSHASTGLQGGTIAHSATTGQTANDHHSQAHVITGADHTASGLTIGHVLTASSSTAFGFAAPAAAPLTSAEAFCTATTALSAATYADITGASVSLAAGTWLILGTIVASHLTTTAAILHGAITDGANAIVAEGSQSFDIATATVAQNATLSLSVIVSPVGTTTYKLRGARGLTTYTSTVTVMDGAGTNTTNNVTNNSDKGTSIRAIKIA